MGVYEDIMASLTGAAESVGNAAFGNVDRMQRDLARMDEIAEQARQMGLPSPLHPRFAEMAPDLADEYNALAQANTAISTSIGAGAMGAAQRAAQNAAPAAPRPAQPMLPGLGSAAVPKPPSPAAPPPLTQPPGYVPGGNPNAPAPRAPQQGTLPGFGTPPPAAPSASTWNNFFGVQPPPPPPSPTTSQWNNFFGVQPPAAPPSPQGGGPGRWTIPGIIAASALPAVAGTMLRNGARAARAPQGEYGRGAGPTEAEIEAAGRQQAHLDQVERERQRDHVLNREEREAQVAAAKALAAKAEAERKQLEQAMAQSDMTESEKVEARKRLQELQDQRAGERQAAQITADARNTDVRIASDNRNTDARISSDNRNTDARIASDNRNTDVREAGANTRAIYQGDVDMRGQDQRAREAQDNFVTTMIANRVQAGQLSVDKANKYLENYFKAAKLPSDILKQVSDSISPFLPYMTNRSAGESAPGFEDGGVMSQIYKEAGLKYDPSKYKATSDFNLADIAAQYGGGPPTAPIQAPDVNAIFSAIPDVDTNPDSYRGMSASSTQLARPTMGGGQTPPMVDSLMPQTMTPPMAPDAEQRIYNSLGR